MSVVVCCVMNSFDSEWNSGARPHIDAVLFVLANEECDDFERGVPVGEFDRFGVGHIVHGDEL